MRCHPQRCVASRSIAMRRSCSCYVLRRTHSRTHTNSAVLMQRAPSAGLYIAAMMYWHVVVHIAWQAQDTRQRCSWEEREKREEGCPRWCTHPLLGLTCIRDDESRRLPPYSYEPGGNSLRAGALLVLTYFPGPGHGPPPWRSAHRSES